mgnify:CR=1 FL=1
MVYPSNNYFTYYSLEPTDPEIIEKLDSQLHKHDYGKVSFRATPFSSGDMSSIIWI